MPLTADRDMILFNNSSPKRRALIFYVSFIAVLIFSACFLFFGLFNKDIFLTIISGSFFVFSLHGLYKVNKAKKIK